MSKNIFQRLANWLRTLFSPGPVQEGPSEPVTPPARPPSQAGPVPPVIRKASLLIIDPLMEAGSKQRLSQALGWNDPDQLTMEFIGELQEVSNGYANYIVTERVLVDEYPLLQDGFRYTGPEFLRCWRSGGWHKPEGVDYHRLLADHNLVDKIERGEIDEVWVQGFPFGGFYESRMAGPGAFWCNAPPLEDIGQVSRRFVIMGFSYERGVGEMLESYGHRAESIMDRVYRGIPDEENLWKRFTRYDKTHPGQAEVGNIHFAPNSQKDYEWGNRTKVLSHSRAWLNFPDLSAPPRLEDCEEWGSGNIRAHHLWWFRRLPHVSGKTGGISNNWWEYIVDPNQVA